MNNAQLNPYYVTITEEYAKRIVVYAVDEDDAQETAEMLANNGVVDVIDDPGNNFTGRSFNVHSVKEEHSYPIYIGEYILGYAEGNMGY